MEPNHKSNTPFNTSLTNKVYFAILGSITLLLTVQHVQLEPFVMGRLVGSLLLMFLLPYFFAWVVWKFSHNKAGGAHITFNLVLTLVVVSQWSQLAQLKQPNQQLAALVEHEQVLKTSLQYVEDPAHIQQAHENLEQSLIDYFDDQAAQQSGFQQQLSQMMTEQLKEHLHHRKQWEAAVAAAPNYLDFDFKLLKSVAESEALLNRLQDYAEHTRFMVTYVENYVDRFKNRFEPEELKHEYVQAAIAGTEEGFSHQRPHLIAFMNSHLTYAETFSKLIQTLQQNPDAWRVDGQVIINDDQVLQAVSGLNDQILQSLEDMERLADQLWEISALNQGQ